MSDESVTSDRIRVLLADDHPAVRAGVRGALEKAVDIEVVGEAADGEEALRLIEELQPDVALLDCRLPKLEGPRVAEAIQERGWPTRVLALSAYKEDGYVYGMLAAGAAGYLLKDEALETVVDAVRAVARGEEWYSQPVMAQVTAWARGGTSLPPAVAGLTGREVEVLRLVAQGKTDRRIGEILCISATTVRSHVQNILDKLDCANRTEAAVRAVVEGILPPSEINE